MKKSALMFLVILILVGLAIVGKSIWIEKRINKSY